MKTCNNTSFLTLSTVTYNSIVNKVTKISKSVCSDLGLGLYIRAGGRYARLGDDTAVHL